MNIVTIIIFFVMGAIGSFIVGFEFGCYMKGEGE